MTTAPQNDRERAEDEAATWLVILSDAPDDAELVARFEAWRAASVLNADVWVRARRAYDLLVEAPPQHTAHWASYAAARPAVRPLPAAIPPEGVSSSGGVQTHRSLPRLTPRRLAAGFGAAVLAALVLFVVVPNVRLRLEADTITATAESRTLSLDDGTQVRVAPESAVDIAFEDGTRRVRLLKGMAFFEVAPDAARPFRVTVGDTIVTVLGTAFEVRYSENANIVAVRHGHVRVENGGTAQDLSAGDRVRISRHGNIERDDAQQDEIGDWLAGEVVVRDRPAGEVVAALRPYYDGVILLWSDTFAARRISGIYGLRDPVTTLRALAAAHGGVVRQLSPWLLVVTSG